MLLERIQPWPKVIGQSLSCATSLRLRVTRISPTVEVNLSTDRSDAVSVERLRSSSKPQYIEDGFERGVGL